MLYDYEVEAVVGKGSFGKVSRIKYKPTGEIFVWKELFYGHMDEREKKLLIQEVNIFKQLNHQNIVKFKGTINDKKNRTFYLVQEYCNFRDLGNLIKERQKKKKSLSERIIWRIFEHCVSALCYMHPKFLHRDLKPQNIMLSRDSSGQIFAKVGDFGLSRKLSTSTVYAQSRVGTPYYMSPEQILGHGYDEKADIWSLGCILFELCTFGRPFTGTTIQQLTKNIKSGNRKPIRKRYTADLHTAIHSCLTVKPAMRPCASELYTLIQPNRRKLMLIEETHQLNEEIDSIKKLCEERKDRINSAKRRRKSMRKQKEKRYRFFKSSIKKKTKKYLTAVLESVEQSNMSTDSMIEIQRLLKQKLLNTQQPIKDGQLLEKDLLALRRNTRSNSRQSSDPRQPSNSRTASFEIFHKPSPIRQSYETKNLFRKNSLDRPSLFKQNSIESRPSITKKHKQFDIATKRDKQDLRFEPRTRFPVRNSITSTRSTRSNSRNKSLEQRTNSERKISEDRKTSEDRKSSEDSAERKSDEYTYKSSESLGRKSYESQYSSGNRFSESSCKRRFDLERRDFSSLQRQFSDRNLRSPERQLRSLFPVKNNELDGERKTKSPERSLLKSSSTFRTEAELFQLLNGI